MNYKYILICVEGKTEMIFIEYYIKHILRLSDPYKIKINNGARGEKSLIEFSINSRLEYIDELKSKSYDIVNIETWVILDCDQKTNSYEKLALLAKNNDIELAYSKPKFEAFLLAIFENYSHHQIKKIDELLNKEMQKEFNEFYKKGESKEICNYIEKFPSKLNNALKFCATWNKNPKGDLFFTIQNLFYRLTEIKTICNNKYKDFTNDGLSDDW